MKTIKLLIKVKCKYNYYRKYHQIEFSDWIIIIIIIQFSHILPEYECRLNL